MEVGASGAHLLFCGLDHLATEAGDGGGNLEARELAHL
jgi:hypothetical protein